MTVKEGEEGRLECEVQGNPQPNVSWRKQVGYMYIKSIFRNVCETEIALKLLTFERQLEKSNTNTKRQIDKNTKRQIDKKYKIDK